MPLLLLSAPAGPLAAVSHALVACLTAFVPTTAFVLDAIAVVDLLVACLSVLLLARCSTPALLGSCNPGFAASLLPSAMMGALLPLPDAPEVVAPEQATAVLLLSLTGLTAVAVLGAAAADALDLMVTLENAAAGLAMLGWIAASLACLPGPTSLTPLAAALALALVVIPDVRVAALGAVTVHDVTAGVEAMVATAGLLGAATDHAGRLAGRLVVGPGQLAEGGVVIGEPLETRLLSIFLPFPEVLKVCLPVLSVPTEGILGAAAALICSALRPGAWMRRSATTRACACCDAEAAAGGVCKEGTLEGDKVVRGELAEYRLLLLLLSVWPRVSECLLGVSVLLPPTGGKLGAASVVNFLTVGLEAWLGRSATTPACVCCDAKAAAVGVDLTSLLFWTGREPLSSAGDAASKAGGVLGEPLLTSPLLPLPPQLGLLVQGFRVRLGSCALEARSIKAAGVLECEHGSESEDGSEDLLAEALSLEVGADLRSWSNRI